MCKGVKGFLILTVCPNNVGIYILLRFLRIYNFNNKELCVRYLETKY